MQDHPNTWKIIYNPSTQNERGSSPLSIQNEQKSVFLTDIFIKKILQNISNSLKIVHAKKNGYSKEVKAKIQKQIITLENRIEKAFLEKLDGNIPHDFWKANNDKWQAEKDKLYIQLEEINKLDKRFYEQSDSLLSFTDNAYDYYLKGNNEQKRRIIEIISDKISYKDKNFDIELKPVFQTIAENQYKYNQTDKFERWECSDNLGVVWIWGTSLFLRKNILFILYLSLELSFFPVDFEKIASNSDRVWI